MACSLIVDSVGGPASCSLKLETVLHGDWDGLDSSHLTRCVEANRSVLYQFLAHGSERSHRKSKSSSTTSTDDPEADAQLAQDHLFMGRIIQLDSPIYPSTAVSELGRQGATVPNTRGRQTTVTARSSLLKVASGLSNSHLSGTLQPSSDCLLEAAALLESTGICRAIESIPWSAKYLRYLEPRDYEGFSLCKRSKKQRFDLGRRMLCRVPLARVTKPIEHFNGRTELLHVFRTYFKTIITLRNHGFEHRNISLENLSIASSVGQVGRGIITSYDEKREPSRQRRPCFIYTMPCKLPSSDLRGNFNRHSSLESLLLCLIWIVTTRCGSHNNVKRLDAYPYEPSRFCDTELGKWNKRRDRDSDLSGRKMAEDKKTVMHCKDKFEYRVLSAVHPHFEKQKLFLRVLRALTYDPQWEETRNLLADPDTPDYATRRALIRIFEDIVEDASHLDSFALTRALGETVRSDVNTSIGGNDCTLHVPQKDEPGWDAKTFQAYKKTLSLDELERFMNDIPF